MPCLTTPRTSRTRGSLRIESVRALSPGRRRADRADSPSGSCTTTRTGWITPLAPISRSASRPMPDSDSGGNQLVRSEEHTSELQSQSNIVCRLLLEKKNPVLYPDEFTSILATIRLCIDLHQLAYQLFCANVWRVHYGLGTQLFADADSSVAY